MKPIHPLPSFSLVIETENLQVVDHDELTACLKSLASQTLSPEKAREVLLIDSGHVSSDLVAKLQAAFPWLRVCRKKADYYEVKMQGLAQTTGEIVIFGDSDCIYESIWLSSLVTPFRDPVIQVLAGQTSVRVTGPLALATTLSWSFPPFSRKREIFPTTNYVANNVAFRREVLEAVPLPTRLPLYRGNCAVHCMQLRNEKIAIAIQPKARGLHPLPGYTVKSFFWRWLVRGHDQLMWFRLARRLGLPEQSRIPLPRDLVTLLRIVSECTYKPLRRLPAALRDNPLNLIYLPISGVFIAASFICMFLGWCATLWDEARVLRIASNKLTGHGH